MRLLIATLYPNYGGSTKVLLASYRALRETFEVDLRGAMPDATSRPELTFPTRSVDTVWKKVCVLPLLFRLFWQEIRHVSASKPDVIYVHDTPSLIIYGSIAKIFGQRVVRHVHGVERSGLTNWLRNSLVSYNIYVATFLVDRTSKALRSQISNCSEVPPVARSMRTGIRRIYVAASVSANKNQMLAVDTVFELRQRGHDASLHLCGPVHEPDYLERLTHHIEMRNVSDVVHIEGTRDVVEILEKADLILCTSKSEAQPLIVLEALSTGVPVIATRIPATQEIAEKIGAPLSHRILADFDAKSLADAIENVDPALFEAAAPRIRSLYDFERFRRELIEVFTKLA